MVDKIRGVFFDWKDDYIESKGGEDGYFVRKHDVGLIAQEELEVEKEHGFGDTSDNMLITHIDDGGGYGMQYSKLVPILINAVKELSAKVEELESKLNN